MNPPAARRIGTVGTALARQQVAILAAGTQHALAAGHEGEICIRGPALMHGYIGGAGDDGPSLKDGWLRTGDLGRLDADGYLTVSGRLKDIIIRGGENLSPGEIEAALLAHAAVKACCVVGAPDSDLGEVPVAFVVAYAGRRVDAEELRNTVADRLPRACVPRRVVLLDALPEIGVGKIDRKALRSLALNSDQA
jgi:acyl-CoA synthetase (AMP-forming)/AMP-acid ligase II